MSIQKIQRLVKVLENSLNSTRFQLRRKSTFAEANHDVLFSGIQPTGIPHIGNYLGAIKNWVELQEKYDDIYLSVVDLHSITVEKTSDVLKNNILDMTASLLACGINPEKATLFQQSTIPEHALLSWVLGCITPVQRLNHLPQWQERKAKSNHGGYLGTFSYPTLQCADILLYKATLVPAGDDQSGHLKLCQDIASSFNHKYQTIFPRTSMLSGNVFSRIRSLRDPEVKMSKSAENALSKVELTDSDDEIWNKIRKAVTDCTSSVTYDPENRPGVSNLIEIHSGFTGLTIEEICAKAAELNTGQYKMAVAEAVIDGLRPIREQFNVLRNNPTELKGILNDGNEKARHVASNTWSQVRFAMGMEL